MSSPDALRRAITACTRCRTRKTKCDRKFPQCTSCVKANAECAALDPATGRSVPRSYVSHLEDKVAALEQELATLRMSSTSISYANSSSPGMSTLAPSISPLPHSPRMDSSVTSDKALSFAKMMFSAVHSPDASSLETPMNPTIRPASLPLYAEMEKLLSIYINHSAPQVPILSQQEAEEHIHQTYLVQRTPTTSEDKTSHYFTHILAAIAYAKDPADTRAEEQHASALYYLPFVLKGSRLASLEAILLLTVYGTNRPSSPGIWYTLGIASRLITDLSLHANAETVKEQTLFWSWYLLDRQICVYLSRPVGIGDNVIHCPIPALSAVPAAFCELRIMQSEIQRILHHSDTLPREYPTLEEWRRRITLRLDTWNKKRPKTSIEAGSEFNLDFLLLNYEQTRLLLHGFSTNLPITQMVVLESSKKIVEIYRDLWFQDSVNFIWLAIHNVHIAASSFIYALLQRPTERTARELLEMKETVVTMLRGMSTRCPASLQILDVFLDLATDVENRLSLSSPSMRNPVGDMTMSEVDFLAMINHSSRDPLWDNFIGGEDFTFMDFST